TIRKCKHFLYVVYRDKIEETVHNFLTNEESSTLSLSVHKVCAIHIGIEYNRGCLYLEKMHPQLR
ncbi:hypothetical protein LI137_14710, partial [Anaerostipes hadrus]